MLNEIPRQLSVSLASKITGLSRKAFLKNFVDSGRCRYSLDEFFDDGSCYIWSRELGEALGRPLTLEEVQEADRKLQAKRDYMYEYRRRKNATI
jgi:hypothetical protein